MAEKKQRNGPLLLIFQQLLRGKLKCIFLKNLGKKPEAVSQEHRNLASTLRK